ncbi:MAG: acyl-CoA desaturase [Acidimicrobiales bacterium]|jgi:fatty acid desaturase
MTTTTGKAPSEYRVLSEQIRGAGLLDRRPWYYTVKITLTILGFALGWAALFVVGNSWATLGVASFLALMFAQVVFLGHDAGHQQIFASRQWNRIVGLAVANALTGLSFGWWVPKHNAHHAYPNQLERDPDIGPGAIAFTFTAEMAERRRGAARLLARWQAWLFFPLLLLEGAGLHISSVDSLVRRHDRSAAVEGALLAGNAALYLTAVFWVLSPLRALAFITLQQSLFGLYLGCSFAPNHKGMPILERDTKMTYVQRQVITARNIRGGRIATFVFGGLNYQIEHHLFPSMPRPNLRRAQRIVRTYCAEHDLAYCEEGVVGSYRTALRFLGAVGAGREPVASTV